MDKNKKIIIGVVCAILVVATIIVSILLLSNRETTIEETPQTTDSEISELDNIVIGEITKYEGETASSEIEPDVDSDLVHSKNDKTITVGPNSTDGDTDEDELTPVDSTSTEN